MGLAFDDNLNLWASGPAGLKFIPCRLDSSNRVLAFGLPMSVGPAEVMERLRMSGDGSKLAVGANNRCRVFDVRTRREIFATPEGSGMSFLSLNPDGKLLAMARWGGRDVKVWELESRRLPIPLRVESGVTVSADVAFSPDGRWLVTVGRAGCVMWKVGSWERHWMRPRDDLAFVMFSPDGAYVLQRDRKSFLELLAFGTGKLLGQLEMPRMDHPDSLGAAFSPDGSFLAIHPMGTRELVVWRLSGVREQLTRLGLDWDLPPLKEPEPTNSTPLTVRFADESR